jgi:hypothetical protein
LVEDSEFKSQAIIKSFLLEVDSNIRAIVFWEDTIGARCERIEKSCSWVGELSFQRMNEISSSSLAHSARQDLIETGGVSSERLSHALVFPPPLPPPIHQP